MNQAGKNKRLLAVLMVLIAISVILLVLPDGNRRRKPAEARQFQIADTAAVGRIEMRDPHTSRLLERRDGKWRINGTFEADPDMVRVLLSVLHHVETNRKSGKNQLPELQERIPAEGILVRISGPERPLKSFYAMGNANKTLSWFMAENGEEVFEAELPGYESYVAGIFEVTEADWRNRLLFSSTWRSLRQLSLIYPEFPERNVSIAFDGNFFRVSGVEAIDSGALMQYLDHYAYFQADRFASEEAGNSPDSVFSGQPLAIIRTEDIRPEASRRLEIFRGRSGDPMIPCRIDSTEIFFLTERRVEALLVTPARFQSRTIE
jgi:hypothetical protein